MGKGNTILANCNKNLKTTKKGAIYTGSALQGAGACICHEQDSSHSISFRYEIRDFLSTQLCNTLIALTLVFLMGSISTKSLILQSHLSRTHTFNLKDIIKFCILKTWTLPNCHYGSCMLLYQYSTTAHNNNISSHEKH